MIANILSIAGSDPSGGAGIQADLKTFSALGCYGMAAITALTAQNTQGVRAVHSLPSGFVTAQIDAVFDDIRVDAVKIGMAGTAETIHAIALCLKKHRARNIVLDPVMVAQSGDSLIDDAAVAAMIAELIPLADVITPNMPEAVALLGGDFSGDLAAQAGELIRRGARAVLLKGGHGTGPDSIDYFTDGSIAFECSAPRIDTTNNHGTGCTLSSAIAALLGQGVPMAAAVRGAKEYITGALGGAGRLSVGRGHGPVDHFFKYSTNPKS